MKESSGRQILALWLRLVGFALLPMALQGIAPMAGVATRVLSPLALSYGTARRGVVEGSIAVLFVAMLTGLYLGPDVALFFMLGTLPICLAVRYVVHSRSPMYLSVMKGTGIILLLFAVAAVAFMTATGTTLADIHRDIFQVFWDDMSLLSENGEMSPAMQAQMDHFISILKVLLLGILLAEQMVMLVIFSVLSRSWMVAAGVYDPEGMPLLSQWSMPFYFIWIFIGIATVIVLGEGPPRNAALNLLVPLGVMYGIQGLNVLGHLARKLMVPPFFRSLLVIFAFMAFNIFFVMVLALTGLFDTWLDIRRRLPLEEVKPPEE
jgi:hypothetical protein